MKITKAECLEFLQTNRAYEKNDKRIHGLFALVKNLNGKWPDSSDEIPINNWLESYIFGADPQRYMEINGYTPREFGCMVWAKNEIRRSENVRKARADVTPNHINCRCAPTFKISDDSPQLIVKCSEGLFHPMPEMASHSIQQSSFLSKVISEKMKGTPNEEAFTKLFADAAKQSTGLQKREQDHNSDALSYVLGGCWGYSFEYFMKAKNSAIRIENDVRCMIDKINKAKGPFCVQVSGSEFDKLKAEQEEKKMRDSNAELKEGDKAIVIDDGGPTLDHIANLIGHEVEIVKFFNLKNVEMAVIESKGSIHCVYVQMLEPVKTERQKATEFYMGVVSAAMNSSSRGQDWGQHTRTIEALIDSGHLKLPVDPSKEF